MIVSFGAAFATLMLTILFGLQEMATFAGSADDAVDARGVGWVAFAQQLRTFLHPRVLFM